jgi:hypothetical protein
MDYTIGFKNKILLFLLQGIKTSCERLNRTMQNIALLRISRTISLQQETVVLQKSKMFSKVFQIKFRPIM